MKKSSLFIVFALACLGAFAQNSMGIGTETPNPNAVLEIVSPTGTQGILIPRYTTAERTASAFTSLLTDTDNGLMVFDTDEGALYFWFSGDWVGTTNISLSQMLADSTSAGAHNITDLADPVNDQDAATKAYVDTTVALITFPTFSDLLLDNNDAGSSSITNLADPTDAQDATTKSYVDTLVNSVSLSGLLSSDNDAGAASIINLADPTDAQDAATKSYVDTLVSGISFSSPWTLSGSSDIYYNNGKVAVGTDTALSAFQVETLMHFFDLQIDTSGVDGRIIADNMYYDGTTLKNVVDGASSFIYMSNGALEFLHGDSVAAGTDRFNSLENSLRLKNNRHAEFRGAVEIGSVLDSTDLSSGQIVYNGVSFYAYDGLTWKDFAGFGPTTSIDGDLGVGTDAPSAKLDVVGNTELNGTTTFNGNVDVNGAHRTNQAVYANITELAGTVSVADTEHIIVLTDTASQTIILPVASSNKGREIIILAPQDNSNTTLHTVQVQGADMFNFDGLISTSPITVSEAYGYYTRLTLIAVGDIWVVMDYALSQNG